MSINDARDPSGTTVAITGASCGRAGRWPDSARPVRRNPWLDVLTPDDVASQVVSVLDQPRRSRTQLWSTWSMVESS